MNVSKFFTDLFKAGAQISVQEDPATETIEAPVEPTEEETPELPAEETEVVEIETEPETEPTPDQPSASELIQLRADAQAYHDTKGELIQLRAWKAAADQIETAGAQDADQSANTAKTKSYLQSLAESRVRVK